MIELDIYCEERGIGAVSRMLGISATRIRHYALNDVLYYNQMPIKKHSWLRLTFFDVVCINLVDKLQWMKSKLRTAREIKNWLKKNMFKHISLNHSPERNSLLDILLAGDKNTSLMFIVGSQCVEIANEKSLMEFINNPSPEFASAIVLPISKIFKDTLHQWQNFGG